MEVDLLRWPHFEFHGLESVANNCLGIIGCVAYDFETWHLYLYLLIYFGFIDKSLVTQVIIRTRRTCIVMLVLE